MLVLILIVPDVWTGWLFVSVMFRSIRMEGAHGLPVICTEVERLVPSIIKTDLGVAGPYSCVPYNCRQEIKRLGRSQSNNRRTCQLHAIAYADVIRQLAGLDRRL